MLSTLKILIYVYEKETKEKVLYDCLYFKDMSSSKALLEFILGHYEYESIERLNKDMTGLRVKLKNVNKFKLVDGTTVETDIIYIYAEDIFSMLSRIEDSIDNIINYLPG